MWLWWFLIPYIGLIMAFVFAWNRRRNINLLPADTTLFVSIILSVRNEEKTIQSLLYSMQNQTYKNFELRIVDDSSEDETFSLCSQLSSQFPFMSVQKSEYQGKKKSLRQGIYSAHSELIVCIDADVHYPPEWLATLVSFYQTENADLLIAPVKMKVTNTFYSKLQALEFLSLQASTGASALFKKAIMCNGANIAFKKDVYLAVQNELVDTEVSGDDMFLLAAIKKMGGKVRYVYSPKAIVDIYPSPSLSDFLQQRMRWVSKSASYSDSDVIFVSFTVLFAQIAIVIAGALAIFNMMFVPIFISLFFSKWVVDSWLLYKASDFLGQKRLVLYSLLLSLVYPFYVISVACCSMICPIKWKNRNI